MKKILITGFFFFGALNGSYAQYDSLLYKAWRQHHYNEVTSNQVASIYRFVLKMNKENTKALGGLAEIFAATAKKTVDEGKRKIFLDSAKYFAGKAIAIEQSRQKGELKDFRGLQKEVMERWVQAGTYSTLSNLENYFIPGQQWEVWYNQLWDKSIHDQEIFYMWVADMEMELNKIKDLAPAYAAMASALSSEGKILNAASWYRKLLEIEPNYPGAAADYQSLAAATGKFFDSWYWSFKAIEMHPSDDRLLVAHAVANLYLNEDKTAISLLKIILNRNPHDAAALREMSRVELFNRRANEALTFYKKVLDIENTYSRQLEFAYLLAACKRYKEAFQITNAALSQNAYITINNYTQGRVLKAFLYSKVNAKDSSRGLSKLLLKKHVQLNPNMDDKSDRHIDIAALYCLLWRKEEAVTHLKKAFTMGAHYRSVLASPYFEELHDLEEFQQLISKERKRLEKERQKAVKVIKSKPAGELTKSM